MNNIKEKGVLTESNELFSEGKVSSSLIKGSMSLWPNVNGF